MLTTILNRLFPDNLDQIREDLDRISGDTRRSTLSAPARKPVATSAAILPDVDGQIWHHKTEITETGIKVEDWSAEPRGLRISLTTEDLDELAVRGLDDQDKVKIAAVIKGDVYAGKSRSYLVRKYRGVPGYSDGNIGRIMAALNAVRSQTPTPTGRGEG